MKTITLGKGLKLPLEAVTTETFALVGMRGSGKSHTAAVLAEEMLKEDLHVAVLDLMGNWWGLRSSADGRHPGLRILIMGGDHGDVPLEPTAGVVVADLIVDERLSVVMDLSHFSKGEQRRFVVDFAERLYFKNRQPLHLFLDETDLVAPQRPMHGQERMLGAIEDIVRRGRARGLGVTMATQRPAVVNKDVLTQAGTLIALRTVGPQDRDAIDAWVKVHGDQEKRRKLLASLASLPVGTAWVWSPGWLDLFSLVPIRRRETFDSSATPKIGGRIISPKRAVVDLQAIRDKISATIERAKKEDPKELKKRIYELETELKGRPKQKAVVRTERVVEKILDAKSRKTLETLKKSVEVGMRDAAGNLGSLVGTMEKLVAQAGSIMKLVEPMSARTVAPHVLISPAQEDGPARSFTRSSAVSPGEEVSLKAGQRRMLQTLAMRHPTKLTRAQLGTLSGYTPSGGPFTKYFRELKVHGYIHEEGSSVMLTEKGFAYLGENIPEAPQTTEEVLGMWRRSLGRGEATMLDYLVKIYPSAVGRDKLGEETGYTASGGTFTQYLGTLKRNQLAEERSGQVGASPSLFM